MTSKPRQSISKIPSPSPTSSPVQSRLFNTVQHDLSPLDFDNEKSVQKQIEDIISEFKAKDKDWNYRYKALLLLQRVVSGNAVDMKSWPTILRLMTLPLLDQLTEIRSTIAKEACQVVTLLAQRMKSKFEPFALQYLYTLIKLVVVKVTVTADAAHQTVSQILQNIQTKSLLQTFLDASLDQHNEQLRRRSSDYILQIINRAIEEPGMILTSAVPALEKSIEKLLVDSGSEIRQQARFCFWAYAELNEERAIVMFYQMTTTTQRNLFSIEDKISDSQREIAEKIRQAIIEEEENQKLVEASTDLDLDISDFRNNNTTNNSVDSNRAKTPTSSSGRASGLKARVSINGSNGSSSGLKQPTDIKRSGSSLGMKSSTTTTSTNSTLEERSIKKTDPLMRSKSSLGTSRRLSEIPTTTTSGTSSLGVTTSSSKLSSEVSALKSKTTSTSPNLSTSNMSGRYSSIGTRASNSSSSSISGTSSPLSSTLTKSSSISSLTRSLPPTKSTSTTTNTTNNLLRSTPPPTTSTTPTNKSTTTVTTSTALRPPSSSLLKRPSSSATTTSTISSSLLKKPTTVAPVTKQQAPPTLTKSKSSASMNNTLKPNTTISKPTTTTTSKLVKDDSTTNLINNFKSRKDSITNHLNQDEIDIKSIEESLNYSNAFNEISQELEGSLRDAKNNLDDFVPEQLTLDDIIGGDNISLSALKRRSIKGVGILENDDFNWIEDSIDQDLIENDPLDFNDFLTKNNSNIIDDDDNNNNNNIQGQDFSDLTLNELTINEQDQTNVDDDEMY